MSEAVSSLSNRRKLCHNIICITGISTDEKRQFERSIANASLCPHERKKARDSPPGT